MNSDSRDPLELRRDPITWIAPITVLVLVLSIIVLFAVPHLADSTSALIGIVVGTALSLVGQIVIGPAVARRTRLQERRERASEELRGKLLTTFDAALRPISFQAKVMLEVSEQVEQTASELKAELELEKEAKLRQLDAERLTNQRAELAQKYPALLDAFHETWRYYPLAADRTLMAIWDSFQVAVEEVVGLRSDAVSQGKGDQRGLQEIVQAVRACEKQAQLLNERLTRVLLGSA